MNRTTIIPVHQKLYETTAMMPPSITLLSFRPQGEISILLSLLKNESLARFVVIPAEAGIQNSLIFSRTGAR